MDFDDIYDTLTKRAESGEWESVVPNRTIAGPFEAPIRRTEISAPLLGEFETAKARDYLLLARDHVFANACLAYEALIDNGHFDPKSQYKLHRYFVETPTLAQLDVLFDLLDAPMSKRNVALVGAKGSGKTALQNCWLSRNDSRLEQEHILWVRVDAHRLYHLWHEQGNPERDTAHLLTLEEYLQLKLVYVLAKHGADKNRALIKWLVDQVEELDPMFDEPSQRYSDATEPKHVSTRLAEIAASIRTEEAKRRTKRSGPLPLIPWRYLEDVVVKVSQRRVDGQRQKRQWLALATTLEGVLSELGVRLLRIVDGVDNVHLTNPYWSTYYDHMLKQCANLIGHDSGAGRVNMMALRDRTYIDIRTRQLFPRGGGGQVDLLKLMVHPASPGAIQQARYNYLCETRDSWQQAGKEALSRLRDSIIPSPESSPRSTGSEATDSFLSICKAACELTADETPADYHFNHRTFLHNRLTLIRQVYYRMKQLGRTASDHSFIRNQVRRLWRRNLLLNGRFFLDTQADWPDIDQELGVCAINPFNIHSCIAVTSRGDDWFGLCSVRILQFLQLNHLVQETAAIRYMTQGWRYPRGLVVGALRLLRAFGMVDSTLVDADGDRIDNPSATREVIDLMPDTPLSDENIGLELSPAGALFLQRNFTDVDTLYYCALDTPLPESFRAAMRSHENKFKGRVEYSAAAIVSATILLNFLARVAEREGASHLEREQQFPEFEHPRGLPHDSPHARALLRASIDAALSSASRLYRDELERYFDDVLQG